MAAGATTSEQPIGHGGVPRAIVMKEGEDKSGRIVCGDDRSSPSSSISSATVPTAATPGVGSTRPSIGASSFRKAFLRRRKKKKTKNMSSSSAADSDAADEGRRPPESSYRRRKTKSFVALKKSRRLGKSIARHEKRTASKKCEDDGEISDVLDSSSGYDGSAPEGRRRDCEDFRIVSDAANRELWGRIAGNFHAPGENALDGGGGDWSCLFSSVDLDTFWEKFLADDAPFSLERYQRDCVGDEDLVAPPWCAADANTDDSDGKAYTTSAGNSDGQRPSGAEGRVHHGDERTLTFRHPLPKYKWAPHPSHAGSTKRQRRFYVRGHGICVENETYVHGVPSCGCFHVADRLTVQRGEDGRGIVLRAWFEARFTKRTFLRRFIIPSTKAEMREWFEGYAKFVGRALIESGLDDSECREGSAETMPSPSIEAIVSEADKVTRDVLREEVDALTVKPPSSRSQNNFVLRGDTAAMAVTILILSAQVWSLHIRVQMLENNLSSQA